MSGLRVGVVGSGISGLAAAHYLSRQHRVTLFESESRLGGHAHTHDVAIGGRQLRVDTGFIVYNHRTYPSFVRLLAELRVRGRKNDMSFGVRCRRCDLEYSTSGVAGLFARRGSHRNIRYHYDLSNELFSVFLDPTMTYSSAVFAHQGQPLAEAQHNKFRRLAEKVQLGPRDHVLEIGCGWGGFAVFAARTYGCRVTGITISEQQYRVARDRVATAGLEDRVAIRLQDYRDLAGRFDKIVSIEMFEALGVENWPTFFRKCEDVLAPDGLMAIQAISVPDHRFDEYAKHCDWIQKWIFPGSVLASTLGICRAMARVGTLGIHHLEDVGIHYALTLRRWREAFIANLERVRALGFDERFIRMWDYYLCACEAAFETRTLGNLQLVLSRDLNRALPGVPAAAAKAA